MKQPPVTVVVDGAIELPPEYLEAFKIRVVPRQAKVGRHRHVLDETQTLVALAAQQPKSRSLTLTTPTPKTFQHTYREVLCQADALVSLHQLPSMDTAVIQARLARNLLWPANIQVLEFPLSEPGFSRLVAAVGDLVSQGWAAEELNLLIERLRTLIRTVYITPASAISKERLSGTAVKSSWLESLFGQSHLLTELDAVSGHFRLLAQEKEPALLGEQVCQLVRQLQTEQTQRFDSKVPIEVTWRHIRYEKWLADFLAVLEGNHVPHQMIPGWSPTLYSHLGRRFVELCLAPPWEDLQALLAEQAQRNKIIQTAAERYTRSIQRGQTAKKQRLSEYRIQLK